MGVTGRLAAALNEIKLFEDTRQLFAQGILSNIFFA